MNVSSSSFYLPRGLALALATVFLVLAQSLPGAVGATANVGGVGSLLGPVSALTGGVEGERFPADKAVDVNPDTHLFLTFKSPPVLGNSGQIRIYDAANNQLVDTLDLSIPPTVPNPGGRSGAATPASPAPLPPSQLDTIGGFTEGFHFYPVILHDNVAVINPHHQVLTWGKTYYVQIDPGVLTVSDGSFTGLGGNTAWTFTTKAVAPPPPPPDPMQKFREMEPARPTTKTAPPPGATWLVVAADGSGDFNTVQGAVDFTANQNEKRVTIFIKNGTYEEIVYFRNKTNLTFLGEDREKVVIGYANDEALNGQAPGTRTNELPGTFPYRRAAFMGDHSSGLQILNLTLANFVQRGAQAEALLLMGGQNLVSHVHLRGHTDTLQCNDSVYVGDSSIEGTGDFLWGRGPAFFNRCEIKGLAASPFMWVRSTAARHGFVFLDCKFETTRPGAVLARNTAAYPDSEVVLLHCALGDFNPAGWTLTGDTAQMHYWEFQSTNLSDGQPANVSRRHPASRQLTQEADAEIIANYSQPGYVLGGWSPALAPIILSQPAAVKIPAGQAATFHVMAAAEPVATYQWRRNGVPLADSENIAGATTATLSLKQVGLPVTGTYSVVVTNEWGSTRSAEIPLALEAKP